MKAIQLSAYGGPEVLTLAETTLPDPGPSEVLIEVHAAAVNPIDCKIRGGSHRAIIRPRLPTTPGMDLSGVVRAVGKHVRRVAVGDEVYASPDHHRMGAYAELALVEEDQLAAKPRSLGHAEAASVPLVALTAYDALVRVGHLQAGERVLIQAGAGGVGTFAIQLAKHLGAEVLTTCSARNAEYVRALGAEVVIDYRAQRYEEIAQGCDLVIDCLGGEHLERALQTVRRGGRIVALTTGLPALTRRHGPWLGLARMLLSLATFALRARLTKSVRFSPMSRKPDGRILEELAVLLDSGAIRPVIDSLWPLEQAAEAHRRVEGGHCRGKVVLTIA